MVQALRDPAFLKGAGPAAAALFLEEIGVGPGSRELQFTVVDTIDQHPVRFDMGVAKALPIPFRGWSL
jgi:hypothetical protein